MTGFLSKRQQKITVPQLMGAMTTVGSSEKYIGIFERIFSDLSVGAKVRDLLNPIILMKNDVGDTRDELQTLFDFRNSTVHEIDFSTIGPWLVRKSIEVDDARKMGAMVRLVIESLEREINRSAPKEFPNRLDTRLLPEDELQRLAEEIVRLENEIAAAIHDYRTETGRKSSIDDWSAMVEASGASREKELEFISNADFIPTRHFDFKRPLKVTVLRQRLEYLKQLRNELSD